MYIEQKMVNSCRGYPYYNIYVQSRIRMSYQTEHLKICFIEQLDYYCNVIDYLRIFKDCY